MGPRSREGLDILGLDLSGPAIAVCLAGLAAATLLCLPMLRAIEGNVCLSRDGIVVMDAVLYRWEDIQSVSCHTQGLLPVCNITFDGRQRQLPAFLLGSNFAAIQEAFEHPERRAELGAGPLVRRPPVRRARVLRVRRGERKEPLISFDAPTSCCFRTFVVTAGLGFIGLVVAAADLWIPLGATPFARVIGGAVCLAGVGAAGVLLRRWRAEKGARGRGTRRP